MDSREYSPLPPWPAARGGEGCDLRPLRCSFTPGCLKEGPTGTRGFSLLEVLVSLAVMAIAVTLVLQLFSANLRAIARSGDVTSAALRGESRIREILAGPDLVEKAWSEATEDGYRMDIAISEVLKERTDNLPVKLLEVTLTIHWREGASEKDLSLKTMKMVDKMAPAGESTPAPA
jgi:prepilin-type N-terminal cleavage/methylation domain-containing protein